MALNLDSVFLELHSIFEKGENASIINYTSNAAWNGAGPGAGIYAVSKGSSVYHKSFSKDSAEYGIRVNAVSSVQLIRRFMHKQKQLSRFLSWKSSVLLGRLGEPEEVATVVAFSG
jgi:NAD(P)-dependent dehydrogenase (short-subunit alcohol dehydrogenase family)